MTFRVRPDMTTRSAFVTALCSDAPAPDRAEKLSLYGWLIGSWQMQASTFTADGTKHTGRGEIDFVWALEGRAIQDVWILPGVFYGTTLRVYNPGWMPGTSSGAILSDN